MSFFDKMIEVAKSMGVKNFAYYKKWALDHLKKQLDEDKQVTKAIEYCEEYLEKAYGVGTIRTWKGKKYIKGPDKKWRRYYDKHERGTSIAISHIMKQINALEDGDVEGLYAIIQKNAGRFRDQNGNVLPEVQQIHDLVEKKQSGNGSKKEEKKTISKDDFNKLVDKYLVSEKESVNNPHMPVYHDDFSKKTREQLINDNLEFLNSHEKGNPEAQAKMIARELLMAERYKNEHGEEKKETTKETVSQDATKYGFKSEDELSKRGYEVVGEYKGGAIVKKGDKYTFAGVMPGASRVSIIVPLIEDIEKVKSNVDKTGAINEKRTKERKDQEEKETKRKTENEMLKEIPLSLKETVRRLLSEIGDSGSIGSYNKAKTVQYLLKKEVNGYTFTVDNFGGQENIRKIYSIPGNNTTKEPEETEQEKHDNRSNAMLGNDNAKKDGVGEEWDESYFKANVDGIKNKLKDKSETEVKKYFTWLDKQFADKPENSYEKRAIAQAKADYYGDSAFKGTDLETVAEKYASDKELKNTIKKTDSMSFTSTDVTRSFLSGTYQEDGYKFATNAHILSMVKEDYPKEDEGKIKGNADQMKYIGKRIENLKSSIPEIENRLSLIEKQQGRGASAYKIWTDTLEENKKEIAALEEQKKTGFVNGIFPNYKRVIPSMGNAKLIPQEGFEDFNKVFKIAKIAAAYGKKDKDTYPTVRVGNKVFNADYLVTVMAMAEKHGLKDIVTTEGEGRSVEFKGDNGSVVIMPMTRADEVRDNEFNANTGEVKIEDKEKAEEFLSGGEKETRTTFMNNRSKYETKFDKDVMDIMNHFEKQKGLTPSKYQKNHNYIRVTRNPEHIGNEQNEDFKNAMNDLKDLYKDYQNFRTDIYNRRFEEGKENRDVSSKEIKTFFEDGIKKIKDKYGIKKSYLEQIEEIMQKSDPEPAEKKHDLEYYKKWALSILAKQKEEPEETVDEPNEETVVKALIYTEMIAKAGYPVGTIREWKGKKYIKIAPNQWKPKYDNMGSRGAKMSLTNLKKAVAKCNSEEELFNLINSNASRFRDENGRPFPEVQELHDLVNKRSGEIKGKKYSDAISKIQNAGNKGKAEVDKLSQGNVEGVAEDAGDDTANALKNGSKGNKQQQEVEDGEETLTDNDIEKEPVKNQKVDVNSGNTDNTDNEPEENENTVTDSQTTERVLSDYLGDKKPNETRQREGNKETIWGNDYTKNHKLEFKQNLAGVLLGKPQMDQELFEELSKYDINNDSYLLAPKYGLEGAEFLNLLSKIKDNRVNIVDSGKEMDEEEMSNQAEQDQDSRVGSSALWDQNVKNAIKTGDVDKIKSAIAKVEKEYEVLSKRAKTPDEKEFLSYELKFRKRDAENALKELQNK